MGMEGPLGFMPPPQPNQEELEKPEEVQAAEPIQESSAPRRINVPERREPPQERVEDFGGKLAEHIIGLQIDDPSLPDRLIEDQKIIRAKYSLPSRESISNLNEYERSLFDIAKRAEVVIRPKSECGQFFEEYSYAGGVHFERENKIGADIDRSSFEAHAKSLGILEHELIHALQEKYSPRMPIELMEYEAYVAGGNNEYLKENPAATKLIFENLIGGSVRHWYNQTSKERGEKVSPSWL